MQLSRLPPHLGICPNCGQNYLLWLKQSSVDPHTEVRRNLYLRTLEQTLVRNHSSSIILEDQGQITASLGLSVEISTSHLYGAICKASLWGPDPHCDSRMHHCYCYHYCYC